MPNMLLYILVAAGVTYAVRVLPLTLLRRRLPARFCNPFCIMCPMLPCR